MCSADTLFQVALIKIARPSNRVGYQWKGGCSPEIGRHRRFDPLREEKISKYPVLREPGEDETKRRVAWEVGPLSPMVDVKENWAQYRSIY